MSRVLVVANEPPWPVHNGGRSRMAGLVTAVGTQHEVTVLAADRAAVHDEGPAAVELLPPSATGRLRAVLGRAPRIGAGLLDRRAGERVQELVAAHRPGAVLVTHSYLMPLLPDLDVPVVLDLPNLEVDRTRSARSVGSAPRRLVAAVEHAKATRWEPAAVRRALLCLAVTPHDAETARRWGAAAVEVVPNASDAAPLPHSPPDGPVLAVGDWRYEANGEALRILLGQVWPGVLARRPDARLVLVGRGAPSELPPGVSAAGFVDDLAGQYAQAALAVAPAVSGAGTQVKVADAVARGRVVVLPPYGAASLPPHAVDLCLVTDDLPAAIVHLLQDVPERHRRERGLLSAAPSWASSAAPLLRWLDTAVSRA